MLMNELGFIVI
jgi:hypothetical protein